MQPLVMIAVDCQDVARLARFWAAALGSTIVKEWPTWALVAGQPPMSFAQVDDPTPGKNRVHIHVSPTIDGLEATVERLCDLGATRVSSVEMADARWVVLADPEGNQFCVGSGFDLDGR